MLDLFKFMQNQPLNPLLSYRGRWGLGALVASIGMLYAFYSQYIQGLTPCNLCMLQRISLTSVGLICLVAFLHNPTKHWARIIYGLQALLTSAAGLGVAARHLWLQHLPEDQVPACGPDFDYLIDSFPLIESVLIILEGSGDCAQVKWHLFGLSMPAYLVLVFSGFLALSILQIYVSLTGKNRKLKL